MQFSESGIWWGFESLPTRPHGVAVGDCFGAGLCPGRQQHALAPRPWRSFDDVEVATSGWVEWFNEQRLHGEFGDATPAEIETAFYREPGQADAAGETNPTSTRKTQAESHC